MTTRLLTLTALTASLLLGLSSQALAACIAAPLRDGDFESQRSGSVRSPWAREGNAGIDIGRGFSSRGRNNAWARNTSGWNAIRQSLRLTKGVTYTLRAHIRTSGNVRDGYFGYRNAAGQPVKEMKFGASPRYRDHWIKFKPKTTGNHQVFAGFWAPGADAWIQVDNVRLEIPCDDVILNPVPPED